MATWIMRRTWNAAGPIPVPTAIGLVEEPGAEIAGLWQAAKILWRYRPLDVESATLTCKPSPLVERLKKSCR